MLIILCVCLGSFFGKKTCYKKKCPPPKSENDRNLAKRPDTSTSKKREKVQLIYGKVPLIYGRVPLIYEKIQLIYGRVPLIFGGKETLIYGKVPLIFGGKEALIFGEETLTFH